VATADPRRLRRWSLATDYFRNAKIINTPTMFLALQMLAGGAVLLAWLRSRASLSRCAGRRPAPLPSCGSR